MITRVVIIISAGLFVAPFGFGQMKYSRSKSKPSTPTPSGTFYLDALMKPRSPDTVYGVYARGRLTTNWTSVRPFSSRRTGSINCLPSNMRRACQHGRLFGNTMREARRRLG